MAAQCGEIFASTVHYGGGMQTWDNCPLQSLRFASCRSAFLRSRHTIRGIGFHRRPTIPLSISPTVTQHHKTIFFRRLRLLNWLSSKLLLAPLDSGLFTTSYRRPWQIRWPLPGRFAVALPPTQIERLGSRYQLSSTSCTRKSSLLG